MKYDYGFFEESLHTLRRLACGGPDVTCLIDAPRQVFPEQEFGIAPKILKEEGWERVILTRSYARKPGKGLARLEALMRNRLPDDLLEFHRLYDEALLTTCTYPIHLWNERKILEGIEEFRDLTELPIRFFRFGEYWDRRELWFGLWLHPTDATWKVAIADMSDRDQIYEENISEDYILAPSFYF